MSASFAWIAWNWAMRLAELGPLPGVREREVEGRLAQAHGLGSHRRAEDVQRSHRHPPALALGAEPVVRGDAALLEA